LESRIDSRLVVDGSIVEYRDKAVGFSQGEGVGLMLLLLYNSLRKREVTFFKLMLQLLEVSRCMGEIPMIAGS
jgi:hypothetical protein